MSNMSYCRFQNTLSDLMDCEENLFDECSDDEAQARDRLVRLAHKIAEQVPIDKIKFLPVEDYDE